MSTATTPRIRKFIEAYKTTKNMAEAVRLAGYNAKNPSNTGWKLMKRPDVSQAIKAFEEEEIRALCPDKNSYIRGTFENFKTEKHPPTRAKYWELGGKVLGYISDKENEAPNIFAMIVQELRVALPSAAPPPSVIDAQLTQPVDTKQVNA